MDEKCLQDERSVHRFNGNFRNFGEGLGERSRRVGVQREMSLILSSESDLRSISSTIHTRRTVERVTRNPLIVQLALAARRGRYKEAKYPKRTGEVRTATSQLPLSNNIRHEFLTKTKNDVRSLRCSSCSDVLRCCRKHQEWPRVHCEGGGSERTRLPVWNDELRCLQAMLV